MLVFSVGRSRWGPRDACRIPEISCRSKKALVCVAVSNKFESQIQVCVLLQVAISDTEVMCNVGLASHERLRCTASSCHQRHCSNVGLASHDRNAAEGYVSVQRDLQCFWLWGQEELEWSLVGPLRQPSEGG